MTAPQPTGTTMVPLARIAIGYNPRRYFDSKKHDELVASLRLRGMLQPILVRPAADAEDLYTVVAGGRRYRAAVEAFGADGEAPVIIRDMTDQEALEAAIDENDIRDDASETEQADAAVRVLAACQHDRAEAGRRLGWSRAKLERRLALANLSEAVKLALDERRIKVGHAELLAAVPSDKQDKALETILGAGLDIGKTRDLLMRVTQNLAEACFDKSECTTCPFNSGTQRALFETHVDDGHCTNAACFQLKTEAVEKVRLAEQERTAATEDVGDQDYDDQDGTEGDLGDGDDHDSQAVGGVEAAARRAALAPGAPSGRASSKSGGSANGPTVTAKSIAGRTLDLREATWRTALARGLADNAAHAHVAILVAALTGTLSQIKSSTLTARAALLVNPSFPDLGFGAKIEEIRDLSDTQAGTALSAIGAAYARDVQSFSHVADLARAFDVDIRPVWQVDRAYLERYTKDELKFIARECGLISHLGEKAFAKRLGGKKADLITGMLNAAGFEWAGRLPSAMTLDGQYGAPPATAAASDSPVGALAA
ncbi:PRTRC system ParB family protein [Sphingobium yanoikuyae]|uniref:PRTRC system ParB family protein n=1 Tax=Sphingobium yanoikuyae TaxID=13690 RepID=UPI000262C590|nr:PRTRC system ParB family protein [Sphingobium yanoikuyae]